MILHCFSMPDRLDECLERGYAISFAGNVTYKSAVALRTPPPGRRRTRCLSRPTRRTSRRCPNRGKPNRPALVADTLAFVASLRGETGAELSRRGRAQRRADPGLGVSRPGAAQPSIDRLRRHAIRPDRDLGQNFLVDSNILGVIDRLAELRPEDVVLEVGRASGS